MSQWNFNSLSKYTKVDEEKQALIDEILPSDISYSKKAFRMNADLSEEAYLCAPDMAIEPGKVCPKCGRKYPKYEIFCFECSQKLKDLEIVNVKDIEVSHEFAVEGSKVLNDFNEILTPDNLAIINAFDFKKSDFNRIIKGIKLTALKHMDEAIKENSIDLDELSILEKIILFAKSFVDVDYKSYGQELGFYSFNKVFVDDRQLDALQITTILHELTHFLLKEILTQILCQLLDASKTREIESIVAFILTYCDENCLIDEYAAHTVEGRFTLFGYQDYSSFLNIQKTIDRPDEEIEMLKTIGNTLAHYVKGIFESFIDDELLGDIKRQFRREILDKPDYSQLRLENCTLLNNVGFLRALQFILVDGFAISSENIDRLIQINDMW